MNLAAMQGHAEDPKKLEAKENLDGWRQVIAILEEGGHFSGINRKAQLKPISWVQTFDPQTADSGRCDTLFWKFAALNHTL